MVLPKAFATQHSVASLPRSFEIAEPTSLAPFSATTFLVFEQLSNLFHRHSIFDLAYTYVLSKLLANYPKLN